MHPVPDVSRVESVVEGLRSSTRRVWWTSFVLVALLSGLWALANPPFAAPDEPAHVIRAVALDQGQLTGRTASRRELKELNLTDRNDYLIVRAPEIYGKASDSLCFVHKETVTAACLQFDGSSRDADEGTYVARHPPAYYAVVGAVSWVGRPGTGSVYAMRFITALMGAAFVATAVTALRRSIAPKLLAVGLAIAITPMVIFVMSTVNPSAPEIAASLAFWVCGLLLFQHARDQVDKWLVTATGIAGCVLALSRQLGPLWIGLIVLTILGVSGRTALRNLARSNWARMWAFFVVASSVAQIGWDLIVKPLDVTRSGNARTDDAMTEIIRLTFGQTVIRYREMIGWFGWLDTPAPALTWIPWAIVLGLLVFAVAVWVTRRQVAVLLALVVATILVPVAIESATFSDAGTFTWQGRYTLPLAVGIPLLAGVALSTTDRGRELATPRFLLFVGAVFAAGQTIAFAQNLQRYTVGYHGNLDFWNGAKWSPPLSSLLLLIVFAIVVVAFTWWLFVGVPGGIDAGREAVGPRTDRDLAPNRQFVAATHQQ
jgi:hypothetical protein